MKRSTWKSICCCSLLAVLWWGAPHDARAEASADEPAGLLLTWQQDPTTTMTIDWHTEPVSADEAEPSVLRYQRVGDSQWREATGERQPFPHSDRVIHRVELTGLEPGTTYRFRVGTFERAYQFRTMPSDLSEPMRFAVGGDVRHSKEWMLRTNRVAATYDPDFVAWGGDLAYANGEADRAVYWYEFFEAVRDGLITDEGRVIPVIAGIGNHEVRGGYMTRHDDYEQTDAWRERIAPYYYVLFAWPGQPGWGALDFGDYLSFVVLDTEHSNPIEGDQTRWLEATLAERTDVPHVFPLYHVPAYPSHRSYDGRISQLIREQWVPLFERHHVRVAFENHDHTYKRTHPIREGRVRSDGIVYVGDGAWGVSTREGASMDEWYIARGESSRHFILVTLHGAHQHLLMVDEFGNVFDEYPRTGLVEHDDRATWPSPPGALKLLPEPGEPWAFRADPDDRGVAHGWHEGKGEQWKQIPVPAFWSQTEVGDYLGYGWYRTTFHLPEELGDEPLALQLESVDEQAWIYLNGELIGEHTVESEGMSIGRLWARPFTRRIEPAHLKPGEQNLLVIRVHASAGSGGMHGPVWIKTSAPTDG